jgi:hypothetical protein
MFKSPNTVGVSFPSPENGEKSRFQNVESWMIDNVQKPSNCLIHNRQNSIDSTYFCYSKL